MKSIQTLLRLSCLLLIAALASCSSDSPTDPGNGDPGENGTGEIESMFDVEYRETTTVFGEDELDVLVEADEESGSYTFDASYFDAAPAVGEVIIVSGVLMRKVISVTEDGANYIVQTEDAVLTDAIQNGTVAWSQTPQWGDVSAIRWDDGTLQKLGNMTVAQGETIQFELDRSGVRHVVQIIPKLENGELTACDFVFQMTKETAGDVNVVFLARGDMSMPKQETEIIIEDGEVSDIRANNRDIRCDLELTLSAAAAAGGEHSLTMKGAALEFPIRYLPGPGGVLIPNPIPMSIGIGIQFVTKITMPSAAASAQASAKLTISSDAGFEYHGTSVSASAELNSDDIRDGEFDSAAPIGVPVDVQFGIAFPRVSLNIVGQEFAWVHTGFTTGSTLAWGPVCKRGYAKMVVEGGYDFGFIGLGEIGVKKTWVERERVVDCE